MIRMLVQKYLLGEEGVWYEGKAQYAMNYIGRVLHQNFSGEFLKEALCHADQNMPYRGPEYCKDEKVYECYYHGGIIK